MYKRMTLKKVLLISFYCCTVLYGCLDLRKCSDNVIGKYYCYNYEDATNYIELREDGNFIHVFKQGRNLLVDKGSWELSVNGYCQVLLSNWKNFNEKGKDYDEFGNGILYISDNHLDITPDGSSSTSFKK